MTTMTKEPAKEKQKVEKSGATKGRKRVEFYTTTKPGSVVSVAGSFNGWKENITILEDKTNTGEYTKITYLPQGRYEYKFVVDGVWCIDPSNNLWEPNEHGTLNSVLVVR